MKQKRCDGTRWKSAEIRMFIHSVSITKEHDGDENTFSFILFQHRNNPSLAVATDYFKWWWASGSEKREKMRSRKMNKNDEFSSSARHIFPLQCLLLQFLLTRLNKNSHHSLSLSHSLSIFRSEYSQ
jgi:hypothetical protein